MRQLYASASEIHHYLKDAAREEGLLPRVRFGTDVLEMRWRAESARWELETTTGRYRCRVLIVAAGRLSEPQMPAIPGLEGFPGPVFHSSAWDDSVDLAGKRVGVVGTGASAIQIVPSIAGVAESIVLFQRTAAYIVPRTDRVYTEAEKLYIARVRGHRAPPLTALLGCRSGLRATRRRAPRSRLASRCRARALAAQVSDPVLRAHLTPRYEIGCKRVLLSEDFYPALARVPCNSRRRHSRPSMAE